MSRRDPTSPAGWIWSYLFASASGVVLAISLPAYALALPAYAVALPTSATLQSEDSEKEASWEVQLKDGSQQLLTNIRFERDLVSGQVTGGGRAGQEVTLEMKQLTKIEMAGRDLSDSQTADSGNSATTIISLRDGSRFAVSKLASDGQKISIEGGPSFESKFVDEIRFSEPDEQQREAWAEFAQAELGADLLVIKNSAGELTKIEGIVSEISADAIMFEFSGQTIPVPMPRVVGVRFYSASVELTESIGVLSDRKGNRLNFVSLKSIADKNIEATLGTGTTYRLPLDGVASIDLSQSRAKYLSDLKVLREEPATTAALDLSKLTGSRRTLLRRIAASKVPGTTIPPSLDFLASGSVTFEVPDEFKRFSGSVELRPSGSFCTPTRVEIWLEGDLAWEVELTEPQQARAFEVELKEGARLRLVAKPIGEFPVGTIVHWSSAELTRE